MEDRVLVFHGWHTCKQSQFNIKQSSSYFYFFLQKQVDDVPNEQIWHFHFNVMLMGFDFVS